MIALSLVQLLSNCWVFTSKWSRSFCGASPSTTLIFLRRHPASTMKDFRRHPPGVPPTSRFPQTLSDSRSSQAVTRLAASRISDPLFSARSPPPSVSMPRTRSCSALFAPTSSFVQWSVSPTRRATCDSTFGLSLQVLLFLLEGSRPTEAPRTSHPPR